MKSSTFVTWLVAVLATGGLVSACGDDGAGGPSTSFKPSKIGESCTRSADCEGTLVCFNNFCRAEVGSAGEGGGPPPGPVLGEEGESCQRAADCLEELRCVELRCVSSTDAGGGSAGPRLGSRGESCQVVSDCDTGLTCVQRAVGGGVCDLVNYGLEPSGKVCGGECAEASDCCELPPALGYKSCTDLLQNAIGDLATTCPVAGPPLTGYELPCFYYRTYCLCADNTWACVANRCTYNAPCTVTGTTWGGCPTYTRANTITASTTCNTDAGRCAVVQPCTETEDCLGQLVSDDTTDTCSPNECTCYENRCYRRCNEDVDCPQRHTCNMDTFVCEPGPGCSSDEECAVRLFDATAECRDGTCVIPCTVDQDCSDSGALGGGTSFSGSVCNSDGVCQALGCVDDAECQSTGGLRLFCVDAPSTTAPVRSAITD